MVILFWALLTSILIKKIGITKKKKIVMLEFEGIRIITLEVKYSIDLRRVKDSINWVESKTQLKCGRFKESINLVESVTLLKYDRVKDSINFVESRTLMEKTLNQN